jgi:aspartate/methionine/tyrosine aminotransferase
MSELARMVGRNTVSARGAMRMTMADMADLADAMPGAYRLENADTYLTPPVHVLEATRAAVGVDEFNSYLPLRGLRPLREAIAARLREDIGVEYDPEGEIVVTCGAGESLLNALLATVAPGERVLLTNPTYSGMAQRVRLAGGVQAFTDLVDDGTRWSLDLASVPTGCRVVLIASPCMPTGTVFTRAELDALVGDDALVIFNGAADKVVFDGGALVHPATYARERTLVVGCVSKNYGMPGWRIGWTAGPRELVAPLEDVHIFNTCMASGFAQAGAAAALSGPQEWQLESVAAYQAGRDAFLAAIAAEPALRANRPQGGYYLLLDMAATGLDAHAFAEELLKETAVAVTPMAGWGADDFGSTHVRVIFTNEPPERLREAGERIVAFARSRL